MRLLVAETGVTTQPTDNWDYFDWCLLFSSSFGARSIQVVFDLWQRLLLLLVSVAGWSSIEKQLTGECRIYGMLRNEEFYPVYFGDWANDVRSDRCGAILCMYDQPQKSQSL